MQESDIPILLNGIFICWWIMALGKVEYKKPTANQENVVDVKGFANVENEISGKLVIQEINDRAEKQATEWMKKIPGDKEDFDEYADDKLAASADLTMLVNETVNDKAEFINKNREALKDLEFTITPKGIKALLEQPNASKEQKERAMKAYVNGIRNRLIWSNENYSDYQNELEGLFATGATIHNNDTTKDFSWNVWTILWDGVSVDSFILDDQNKITLINVKVLNDQVDNNESQDNESNEVADTQKPVTTIQTTTQTITSSSNSGVAVGDAVVNCEDCPVPNNWNPPELEDTQEISEDTSLEDDGFESDPDCPEWAPCNDLQILEYAPPIKTQHQAEYDRCLDDEWREKLDVPSDKPRKAYRKLFNRRNKRLSIYTDDYKPSWVEKSDLKSLENSLRFLDRKDGGVDWSVWKYVNAAIRLFDQNQNRLPSLSQRQNAIAFPSWNKRKIKSKLDVLWYVIQKYRTHENNGTFLSRVTGLLVNERKNADTDSGNIIDLYNKHNENHDVDLWWSWLKLTHKERRWLRQLVGAYGLKSPTSSDRVYVRMSRKLMNEMKKDPRAARNIVNDKPTTRRQRKIHEQYKDVRLESNNFLKTVVEWYAAGMDMDDISRAYIIGDNTKAYNSITNDQTRSNALDQQDFGNSNEELFMSRLADLNYDGKVTFDDKSGVKWLQLTKIFRGARSEMMQTVKRKNPDGTVSSGEGLTEQYAEKMIVYNILCFSAKMSHRLWYSKMFGSEFQSIYEKDWTQQSLSGTASPWMSSHAHEWVSSVFVNNPGILKFVQDVITNSPLPAGYIMKHGSKAFEMYHEETKESVARAAWMTHAEYEKVNIMWLKKYEVMLNKYKGTDYESVIRSGEFRQSFLSQFMTSVAEYGQENKKSWWLKWSTSAAWVWIWKAIELAEGRNIDLSLWLLSDGDENQWSLWLSIRRSADLWRGWTGYAKAWYNVRAWWINDFAYYPVISVWAAKELSNNKASLMRSLSSWSLQRTTLSMNWTASFRTSWPYAEVGIGLNRDRDKVGWVDAKYEALKWHMATMSLDVIKKLPSLKNTKTDIEKRIDIVQKTMQGKYFSSVPREAAANMLQTVMYFAPKETLNAHEQQIAASMVADFYATNYKNEELQKIKSKWRYLSWASIWVSGGVWLWEFGQWVIPIPRITFGAAVSFTKHKGLTMRDTWESLAQMYQALDTWKGNHEIWSDCDDRAIKFLNRTIQWAHKRYCHSRTDYRYDMTRVNPPEIQIHPTSENHLIIPRRLRDGDASSWWNFAGIRISQSMKGYMQTNAQGDLIIHKSTPLRLVDVSGWDFTSFVINVWPQPWVDSKDITKMRNSTNDLLQLQAGRHNLVGLRTQDAADGKYEFFSGANDTDLPEALAWYDSGMTVETISTPNVTAELDKLEQYTHGGVKVFENFFFDKDAVGIAETAWWVPSKIKIWLESSLNWAIQIDPNSTSRLTKNGDTLVMPTTWEVVVTKKTDGSYHLTHVPATWSGIKKLTFTYNIEWAQTEVIDASTIKSNIQDEILTPLGANANNFPILTNNISFDATTNRYSFPFEAGKTPTIWSLPSWMTLANTWAWDVLVMDKNLVEGGKLVMTRTLTWGYTLEYRAWTPWEFEVSYTEAVPGWISLLETKTYDENTSLIEFSPNTSEWSIDTFFNTTNESALQELENVRGANTAFLWMMYHSANVEWSDGDIDTEELQKALWYLKTCLVQWRDNASLSSTKQASKDLLTELDNILDGSGNIKGWEEFAAAYLVDRMKQVFAMEPGYKYYTIKRLFAERASYFENLESPSWKQAPLSRSDYKGWFDKSTLGFDDTFDIDKKKVHKNIIGYTAFYRKSWQLSWSGNKYRRRSMTAPGATTVYGNMIQTLTGNKANEVRKRFFENLEVNEVEKKKLLTSVEKTLETKLWSWVDLPSLTLDDIKLLSEGKDVKLGSYTVSMKSQMVAYLLWECANESTGIRIGEISIKGEKPWEDQKEYKANVWKKDSISHSETVEHEKKKWSCMKVIINTPETRSEAYFAWRSDFSIWASASFKPERKQPKDERPTPNPTPGDEVVPEDPIPDPTPVDDPVDTDPDWWWGSWWSTTWWEGKSWGWD